MKSSFLIRVWAGKGKGNSIQGSRFKVQRSKLAESRKRESWEAGKLICGELNGVFTLTEFQVSTRNLKISSLSKTGDMSARPVLVLDYR